MTDRTPEVLPHDLKNRPAGLPPAISSDFASEIRKEHEHVMVQLGSACRRNNGDLTAPAVQKLLAKADALDVIFKLWEINPNR